MGQTLAPDDIVRTRSEVAPDARRPVIVVDTLCAFLDRHGLGKGEPRFAIVGEGHSNLTYTVTRGDTTFILRRPPRPPLPPSAHDVLREARVLVALQNRARVPKVLAVCADESVIGAPFYVMEFVAGDAITDTVPEPLRSVEEHRRIGDELIDALVELHAVDWRAAGLEGFGKPEGYLERQLRRFTGLWEHNKTREIPAMERVGAWLADGLPQSPPATIVHGDYRLGNVLVAPGAPARVAAILDWEMSTIGDPLADLGYLCTLWIDRRDPYRGDFELSSVTRQEGFPLREELVARYEERSGRSMTDIRWYQVLALWKGVVFMEGNYRRAVSGQSNDAFMEAFGDGVVALAERAEAMARGE
jgi:aminoglycoside phosphotransferase (APT) family kinase protein